MNYDPKSVGEGYPEAYVHLALHGLEIPPWLDQCLDILY
jgi:hypothetical protein